MIKLFFVTDIHGSNVCYRKFLNALPIYGVDVAVLLGDLTGGHSTMKLTTRSYGGGQRFEPGVG